MHILITAGGTSEKIDDVRKITNSSTGELGALIAKEFALRQEVESIHLLTTKQAILPDIHAKITTHIVESHAQVQARLRSIMEHHSPDVIIHSMAISDYHVSAVSSLDTLAEELSLWLESHSNPSTTMIKAYLEQYQQGAELPKKMSSSITNPLLMLAPNAKLIDQLRALAPHATIVGFKLAATETVEELIVIGFSLLQRCQCDFVLANRVEDISEDGHVAFFIDADRQISTWSSKPHIAQGIVERLLKERNAIKRSEKQ
ncbi:phosphopantothenoylcysteine decarboxylase [Entomospira culicis]|uniref:DNA/pantothenate metabolism flavoprotein C-terminal domain-containing protein n=1 Tax=Entomospira culicis TaxID=2719989 RepID=A0A968GEQ8_9SPIO|nr:phosphopantothenoylcysteine decarboxylase [Entomospira culicis]NIZ18692.1 hypothetical protein [Entomospira culicis]NIZ68907.1 hypothetical protein [Entomospira culicis]WDI37500.1 phosphopantothenoylcysteine decarboxylase [Entomospira culicis]WDI39128.1 phosphopantothenoylcysteine decarboxylase [Entomospira culicis]